MCIHIFIQSLSLTLSLSLTHTHTHTHIYIYIYKEPRGIKITETPSFIRFYFLLFPETQRIKFYDLRQLLKQNSVVYAKKGRRLPKVCHRTPRLRAVLLKEHTFHGPVLTSSLPPLSSTTQSATSRPSRHDKTHKHFQVLEKTEDYLSRSEPFLPLPTDLTLLRRPTFVSALPVINRDVHILAQSLKPLVIDDSFNKTVMFYQTHYPLLLERRSDDGKEKIVTRRCVTPLDDATIAAKRAKGLNQRIVLFNQQLEHLETDADNEDFQTELKTDTFDPRQWPWNSGRY